LFVRNHKAQESNHNLDFIECKIWNANRNSNLTSSGYITPESEGANLITTGGSAIPLQAQGWNPLMNGDK
jgi:hypothetical protein